jgi:hypothetical protein
VAQKNRLKKLRASARTRDSTSRVFAATLRLTICRIRRIMKDSSKSPPSRNLNLCVLRAWLKMKSVFTTGYGPPRECARGCIHLTAKVSLSALGGGEGRGEVGSPPFGTSGTTHLTLPALPRRAPPSPPASGRRGQGFGMRWSPAKHVCMP